MLPHVQNRLSLGRVVSVVLVVVVLGGFSLLPKMPNVLGRGVMVSLLPLLLGRGQRRGCVQPAVLLLVGHVLGLACFVDVQHVL